MNRVRVLIPILDIDYRFHEGEATSERRCETGSGLGSLVRPHGVGLGRLKFIEIVKMAVDQGFIGQGPQVFSRLQLGRIWRQDYSKGCTKSISSNPVRIEATIMIFCPVAWIISHAGVPGSGPKTKVKMNTSNDPAINKAKTAKT